MTKDENLRSNNDWPGGYMTFSASSIQHPEDSKLTAYECIVYLVVSAATFALIYVVLGATPSAYYVSALVVSFAAIRLRAARQRARQVKLQKVYSRYRYR